MKNRASTNGRIIQGGAAFTLVEVLVAMAVFVMMAIMVANLTDGAMRTAGQSQRRIGVDASVRQALDRIALDLSHAISRKDVPFRLDKASGNDRITFLADVDGYTAGRGVSSVSYRVANGLMQRGVEVRSWENSGNAALAFKSPESAAADPDFLTMDNASFETLSPDIFRIEIAFLMGDGSIVEKVGTPIADTSSYVATFAPPPGASPAKTIHSVIVGVVALDERTRGTLEAGAINAAAQAFSDAEADKNLAGVWKGFLFANEALMPTAVRRNVRFYQRYISVGN